MGFYKTSLSVLPSHETRALLTYLAAYLDISLCSSSILELDNKKSCSIQLGIELPFGILINLCIVHDELNPISCYPLSFFDLLKARECLGVLSIIGDQVLVKHIYIFIVSFSRKEK